MFWISCANIKLKDKKSLFLFQTRPTVKKFRRPISRYNHCFFFVLFFYWENEYLFSNINSQNYFNHKSSCTKSLNKKKLNHHYKFHFYDYNQPFFLFAHSNLEYTPNFLFSFNLLSCERGDHFLLRLLYKKYQLCCQKKKNFYRLQILLN